MKNPEAIKAFIHCILISTAVLITGAFAYHKAQDNEIVGKMQTASISGLYPPAGYGVVNPDINQANIKDNLCNKNWSTKSIRPPVSQTNKIKAQQVFDMYGYNNGAKLSEYEEDHLISLELGGNPIDSKNLWPQPYNLTVNGELLGARQKDRAEGYLHTQVCNGTMSLVDAQTAIKTDWVKVYHQAIAPRIWRAGATMKFGSVEPEEISNSDDE